MNHAKILIVHLCTYLCVSQYEYVSFIPDYERFGIKKMSDDICKWFNNIRLPYIPHTGAHVLNKCIEYTYSHTDAHT